MSAVSDLLLLLFTSLTKCNNGEPYLSVAAQGTGLSHNEEITSVR